MKLSFDTMEKLRSSGRYTLLKTEEGEVLVYYPPSAEEASGVPSETLRTLEMKLRKDVTGYEVLGALVKENGRTVRELSPEELELWLEFLEG